jgi:hypothetical protein
VALGKLKNIPTPMAAVSLAVTGVAVFWTGLSNPFEADDTLQIVNNTPVHSIANIAQFFTGGTFYFSYQGPPKLSGDYYRPLMSTFYSVLYTIFGPNPFWFHLFQLLVCVGSAFLVYLVLRFSVSSVLAFALALVFLVHPANSQIAFAIPTLQDALFLFFGLLALWLLLRFHSVRSLWLVAACLLLSLFSKETGILFIGMAFFYLIGFDRCRLYPFIGVVALPFVAYLALKANAVGIFPPTNLQAAPIANLGLGPRLLTAPSVALFDIGKIVFPVNLASGYYWVNSTFTVGGVLLPLLIDCALVALIGYVASLIRRRGSPAQFRSFLFFGAWAGIGILFHLQIIPLDMTASESWLYFPLVGVLGMIGLAASTLVSPIHVDRRVIVGAVSIVVVLFGFRTALRGTDWSSLYTLAAHDIAVSPDDYNADVTIAYQLAQTGNLASARDHATHAVSILPTVRTYHCLGTMLFTSGDYAGAQQAFFHEFTFAESTDVDNSLAALTVFYGNAASDQSMLVDFVNTFPNDGTLWLYLAIFDQNHNANANAKVAISNAYALGVTAPYDQKQIMNNQPIVPPSRPTFAG